jgi:predicted AAA+ superfamily ATPase
MGHNFEEEVKINKYKLEDECERQASTYLYWATKNADAKSALNEADDALKLVISGCDLSTRNNWKDSWGKQTENSIKAVVESNEQVLLAKKKVSDCQREVNTLTAAVSAFEHRRDELKNLTGLLIGGFYSAPNGGRREGVNESAQREERKNLNKKKKSKE